MPPHHQPDPAAWLIGELRADFNKRHAWLSRAAEQVRQWKAEDEANGMPWGDEPEKMG